MATALVTGGAGFIGSHLVDELLDRGWTVQVLDDLSTGSLHNLSAAREQDAFTFFEGDIRDPEIVSEALDGVDTVFHQAAQVSVQQSFDAPQKTASVNCTGTSVLFESARDAGVDSAVVASSSAVYGSGGKLPKREDMTVDPESPYALSKYYTEQTALKLGEQYGIGAIALRYFNVFGPRQDPEGEYAAVIPAFIDLMLEGDCPVIYGDGEQSRDFVFVEDVVAANVLAAESDCAGDVFNVACGDRTSVNELVAQLNEALNTEIDPIYDDPRPGDIRHSTAAISKAQEKLRYQPGISFEKGLGRTVEWFREYK